MVGPIMTLPPEAIARFASDLAALVPAPSRAAPLAVAVSGGPDSMAMLALATGAFPDAVIAATVDHRLRPASADEAAMVAAWCRARRIPHATLSPDKPPAGASIQAQARHVRYALLGDWALAANASALATAHHADDQAETFLMRAARGSGPAGLAGIRPRWEFRADRWTDTAAGSRTSQTSPQRRPASPASPCYADQRQGPDGGGVSDRDRNQTLPILRPLLHWRRTELRALAARLPFVDDPSNTDPRHDRTHARALLATGRLDPLALAAAAAHCREVDAALTGTIDWLWRDRSVATDDDLRLDMTDLPRELRRRLARRAIGEVRATHTVTEGRWSDAANIESLLDALDSGGSATQAGILASAGHGIWRFRPAPPRRAT